MQCAVPFDSLVQLLTYLIGCFPIFTKSIHSPTCDPTSREIVSARLEPPDAHTIRLAQTQDGPGGGRVRPSPRSSGGRGGVLQVRQGTEEAGPRLVITEAPPSLGPRIPVGPRSDRASCGGNVHTAPHF